MYISDKIVGFGDITPDGEVTGQYVVLRSEDYPNEPSMRRTTYFSNIEAAMLRAKIGGFDYNKTPNRHGDFIGVEVSRLKEVRPSWCTTKDDLLAQYEAMQREDGSGPIKNLDLRKDPELLKMAKQLWSERLANLSANTPTK